MGNTVARVDPIGLPPPMTQSIDEKELRPTLSKWSLVEVETLRKKLLQEFRNLHPNAPFSLEMQVKWPTFFLAFEDVSDQVNERVKLACRKQFHSSCHAYAMLRKSREVLDGELLADEESLALESNAEEQTQLVTQQVLQRPPPPSNRWKHAAAATESGTEPTKNTSSANNRNQPTTGDLADDELSQRIASMGNPSQQELDDMIAADDSDRKQMAKPKLFARKTWNPAVISPVFFGYTLAKAAQEDEKQLKLRKAKRKAEVSSLCIVCHGIVVRCSNSKACGIDC